MSIPRYCCYISIILCASSFHANAQVQLSDPVMVTTAVFDAARNDDDALLAMLCDPQGENDGDTRRICTMRSTSEDWADFVTYFEKGSVSGPAVIDQDTAEVPILFGPDGQQSETMILIRRGKNWYLLSF